MTVTISGADPCPERIPIPGTGLAINHDPATSHGPCSDAGPVTCPGHATISGPCVGTGPVPHPGPSPVTSLRTGPTIITLVSVISSIRTF